MLKRNKQKFVAEINVVPYIDVMLVLLIIFMATAPLLTQGVNVDLPQAAAKTIKQDSKPPVIVSIDVNGDYFLNVAENPKQNLPLSNIMVKVAALHELEPSRAILVKGDKQVDYGKVVTLMAALQQTGASSIGLVTEDIEQ